MNDELRQAIADTGAYRIFGPHETDTLTDLKMKREWLQLLAEECVLLPGTRAQLVAVVEQLDAAIAKEHLHVEYDPKGPRARERARK